MISIKDFRETDLFKGLELKQLQLFSKHFIEKTFETGELVFTQGRVAENLYILLDGEVPSASRPRARSISQPLLWERSAKPLAFLL